MKTNEGPMQVRENIIKPSAPSISVFNLDLASSNLFFKRIKKCLRMKFESGSLSHLNWFESKACLGLIARLMFGVNN